MDEADRQRMEFGHKVAELREERGWSQPRLAWELAKFAHRRLDRQDVVPPTRQTVSRWELGQRWPDSLNGYLLCRLFGLEPEELCLHRVVTSAVLARYERPIGPLGQALTTIERSQTVVDGDRELDWERLSFVLHAMRHVDAAVVEDQWMLTQRYLADRRHMRGRSLLELVVQHVVRLRQLRSQTTDPRLHRELTVMLGETLIGAGLLWTGLTDFGLAIQAYRGAVALGEEVNVEWLTATALMSEAQLSGIHATAPWTPAARLALLEKTEGNAAGASAPIRLWLHATRAQIHALLGQQADAQRALELAGRAQALCQPGTPMYFAMNDPVYFPIQIASVALLGGRPREAAGLFSEALTMIDVDILPIRTWAMVYLADAEAAAGDFERAEPTLAEAHRMAKEIECPLLEHSAARIAAREVWVSGPGGQRRHQLNMDL